MVEMNLQRGQGAVGHLLKMFVNNKVADYNETIFEAVTNTSVDGSQADDVWNKIHTVFYSPVINGEESVRPRPGTSANRSENNDRIKNQMAETWTTGIAPKVCSNWELFLSMRLPESVTIQDYSVVVLNLLRVLNGISRYWGSLYDLDSYDPISTNNKFLHHQLTHKVNQHLKKIVQEIVQEIVQPKL
ncbi:E3 ubiquitin-protein ligase TRIP12-like [Daphnia pulicaria]|uniref:E3 ubiquitin-protein ligase TRIP12-like n=1 Tax=Daphnia pulicaria TaxID=35523 RepID=UPI001EEC63DA|nr:E3 ubiquitin-protein ligase TRIP12-like [Daphnia pulicaria]